MELRSGRVFTAPSDDPDDTHVTNSRNVAKAFREMLAHFETTQPTELNVAACAAQFNLQNRRVYDFFSVSSAVCACSPLDHGVVRWHGVKAAKQQFEDEYVKFEVDSLTVPFDEWFSTGQSPTLGTLATKIMCLFYAMGVDTLHLHAISNFFVPDKSPKKSLERRIYLVLGIIEIMGYLEHLPRSGDYRLTICIDCAVERAMDAKRKYACAHLGPSYLESLLQRLDSAYLAGLRRARLVTFQAGRKSSESTEEALPLRNRPVKW